MKQEFNKRLKFSTKEKRGGILVLVILVSVIIVPGFFYKYKKGPVIELTAYEDSIVTEFSNKRKADFEKKKQSQSNFSNQYTKKEIQLDFFDPDTLTIEGWQNLGLSYKQSEVLLNYKERIGGFVKIENLYEAFVLDSTKVNKWKPYLVFNAKPKKIEKIELNSADKEELTKLKGIGPAYAERIIKFRDKLGGFHSSEQLREVFGIPSETLDAIIPLCKVNENSYEKLKINQLTIEELAKHPYFNYKTAKIVVNYREQHGTFKQINDLKKIQAFDKEFIEKINCVIKNEGLSIISMLKPSFFIYAKFHKFTPRFHGMKSS
mgnify:CR=1 FL=1